jgi:molybdenum cofactor cytidylyltransferase
MGMNLADPSVPIGGIILAAGAAQRMGALKQLLLYRGKPLLQWTIDSAIEAGLSPVIIVLGHQRERILAGIDPRECRLVNNPDHGKGQSTSLQIGIAALPTDCPAVVCLLGDQPKVGPAVIRQLAVAYRQSGAPIVIPTCRGRRGNPVLLDRALFASLAKLSGDTGGRALFADYQNEIESVEVGDDAILFDIDTPADYRRLTGAEVPLGDPDPGVPS